MEALRIILLVAAVAMLLKSVWLLLWPAGVKSTVDWWGKMPAPASRMFGYGAMVVGLLLIGMAIAKMADAVVAAITVLGTVCVVFGMFYQWPAVLAAMNKPFGSEGNDWVIRTTGVVLLALSLALGYIYLRSAA